MCFWNWYGFGGWFAPIIMMLMMLVFIFVVVLPFVRCGMGAGWGLMCSGREKADDDALGLAKRRYVSGEISKEAFEEIKRTLS